MTEAQLDVPLGEFIFNLTPILKRIPGVSIENIEKVISIYPVRISAYYFNLIDFSALNPTRDPIWKQCIPDIRELNVGTGYADALGEEENMPVPCIIHKYPNRVLFYVSDTCAMYCRFCTRKRKVGKSCSLVTKKNIDIGIKYIEDHPEIKDVILSGGDPLMLDLEHLEYILSHLRAIKHVAILRIGTRVPVTYPMKVTQKLCRMLKKYFPIYINTHFNHPREITTYSSLACAMLVDSGIPLGNQTVLLKDVNDDLEIMKDLMFKLLTIRVKPYYIYLADRILGTDHFWTDLKTGLDIIDGLRKQMSGLGVPQFVVDCMHGRGKIPILPTYIAQVNDNKYFLTDYDDVAHEYVF